MDWLLEHLNTIGLIFDIIGVLMMFVVGLRVEDLRNASFKIPMSGPIDLSTQGEKRYMISKFGLVLVIMGFILQAVSNYF